MNNDRSKKEISGSINEMFTKYSTEKLGWIEYKNVDIRGRGMSDSYKMI